jgi:hypothetical protein
MTHLVFKLKATVATNNRKNSGVLSEQGLPEIIPVGSDITGFMDLSVV